MSASTPSQIDFIHGPAGQAIIQNPRKVLDLLMKAKTDGYETEEFANIQKQAVELNSTKYQATIKTVQSLEGKVSELAKSFHDIRIAYADEVSKNGSGPHWVPLQESRSKLLDQLRRDLEANTHDAEGSEACHMLLKSEEMALGVERLICGLIERLIETESSDASS